MQTISECVSKLILQKPFISEALQKGLINTSSLARSIKPEIEAILKKEVQQGAIVVALNRFTDFARVSVSRKLITCLQNLGDIIVRSGLTDYTYKNSESLFSKHLSFVNKINVKNDVFFTFVQGVFESSFIVSSSLGKIITHAFEKEKQVSVTTNLSAITVRLPKENLQTAGLYYHILQQVAWEGINIINVISTANEFSIIVKDTNIEKAFSAIKNLKKKKN